MQAAAVELPLSTFVQLPERVRVAFLVHPSGLLMQFYKKLAEDTGAHRQCLLLRVVTSKYYCPSCPMPLFALHAEA